jgi:hypothetical protein
MTPDPTNPVLAVEQAWSKFSPLEVRETRDYAELSFGEHQTQAMTMAPDDWVALDLAIKALAHLSQGWKPDREAVARIIDPGAWRVFDSELERVKRHHPHGGYDPDNFKDRTSLALADAILALPTPAPKDEGWRPPEGWVLVPREPTEAMLKAAFVAMNETPSGTWKRMKAEGQTPRRMFDVKMAPRYRAMIAAAPTQSAGGTER